MKGEACSSAIVRTVPPYINVSAFADCPARKHHKKADKLKVRACGSEARSSKFAEDDNKQPRYRSFCLTAAAIKSLFSSLKDQAVSMKDFTENHGELFANMYLR